METICADFLPDSAYEARLALSIRDQAVRVYPLGAYT